MLRAKATIDAFPIDENVLEMQIGPSPCILFFTSVTASKQLCTLNEAALGYPLMFSTFLISGADNQEATQVELVSIQGRIFLHEVGLFMIMITPFYPTF